MPSLCAFSFIIFTKSDSLPAMYSAMETAASFALDMDIHFIMVSTVWISPGSRKTCEPPIDAAYSLVLTSSSSFILPDSRASKIRFKVIIFVILAGIISLSLFLLYNIRPLLFSIRTADFEEILSELLLALSLDIIFSFM